MDHSQKTTITKGQWGQSDKYGKGAAYYCTIFVDPNERMPETGYDKKNDVFCGPSNTLISKNC